MAAEKILVTGAHGQLGSELRRVSANFPQHSFLFTDADELNITDEKAVQEYFNTHLPTVCINCAAYTAVDKAETEKETAQKVNADAAGYLANASADHHTFFIHISTDYVFNGRSSVPYKPNDQTDPVNFYGLTKLKGEEAVIKNNPAAVIIRTAWVYSSYGHNFVKTMIRLMNERPEINVVSDQKGTPTYAADLAALLMQIITREKRTAGIYHYTNEGETTWFEFAEEIAELIKTVCKVNPITTDAYPTPAARPAFSLLDKSAVKTVFHAEIPQWKESLKKCILLLQDN